MRKTTTLICALLIVLLSKAQITIPTDIPSPNAAELGEFGNVPVSCYTGKTDISIPIYTFSVKGVELPVMLSYNSGGVMINKLPGWTGENWTLQAGGLITRIRQGLCDETIYPSEFKVGELNKEMRNYFQSYHTLNTCMANPANEYRQLKDTLAGKILDLAPDLYCFNFMGHSGQFFLGNDGQWKVLSDENIDVVFDYTNSSNYILPFIGTYPGNPSVSQPKTIKGFLLRDGNGIQYYFGGSCNYIEYTHPLCFKGDDSDFVDSWTANSWYLKEVRDRFGNLLYSLEYERGYYIAQMFNNAFIIRQSSSSPGILWDNVDEAFAPNYSFSPQTDKHFGGYLNSPIYLKSILMGDSLRMEFSSSDIGIRIEDLYDTMFRYYQTYNNIKNNILIGSYILYYLQSDNAETKCYQYDSDSGKKSYSPLSSTQMRQLDTIVLKSTSGDAIIKYIFSYNKSYRMYLSTVTIKDHNNISKGRYDLVYDNYNNLPYDYISTKDDHWGFCQGSSYQLPVPGNISQEMAFYSQRNPNIYSKYGMLKQITYPTGGRTVFEYENHDFSSYATADRLGMTDSIGIAGGVRIKAITDYEDNTGQHQLRKRVFSYVDPNSGKSSGQLYSVPRYFWNRWRAYNNSTSTKSYLSLFKCVSILPLSTSFGPHVGYSYVRETFTDGSYKEYRYSNLSGARDYRFMLEFNEGTETPYDLYSSQEYRRGRLLSVRACDSTGIEKHMEEYHYREDAVEQNYVLTTNLTLENYVNNMISQYNHFTGGVYKLFYPKYDVIRKTTTTNYPLGSIVEQKVYNKFDMSLPMNDGTFSHTANVRATRSETTTRGSDSASTIYSYSFDTSAWPESQLAAKQFFLMPTGAEEKMNNVTTHKWQTTFQYYHGYIVPQYEKEWKNGQDADIARRYLTFDTTNANLLTYQDQGQPVTTLEWTINSCLLSKKTIGEDHFVEVFYNSANQPEQIWRSNGVIKNYDYDSMGRLSRIRGAYGVEKEFYYNYRNK